MALTLFTAQTWRCLCSWPRHGVDSVHGQDMALSLFTAKTWRFLCSRPRHGVDSVHGQDIHGAVSVQGQDMALSLFTATTWRCLRSAKTWQVARNSIILSNTSKILLLIILNRMRQKFAQELSKYRTCFRIGGSTSDMLFRLQILIKKDI